MISTTVSPRLSSSGVCHSALEFRADRRVLDRLVIGIDHRDQAGIGGALHVVLAAQRVQAGAGPADLAGDQRQRDQAARVVGAVDVLRDAHAPEDDRRLGAGVSARDLAQGRGVDAADRRHLLRAVVADVLAQRLEILGVRLDILPVVRPSSMIVWISALSSATSRPGLKRSVCVACRTRLWPRGSITMSFGAAFGRLLEEGRGDRVVLGRLRADDDDDVGVLRGGERRRHRARADPFHQRRDRRGVAQPRAMVDIVAAEAGAHQLLEQVGLLVRALGRAEPGQRAPAVAVADAHQARGGAVERLVPGRLAEMRKGVGRIDIDVVLRDAVLADQRLRQPVGVVDVVEAEPALDAEPVVVGRPVPALDRDDAVVLIW